MKQSQNETAQTIDKPNFPQIVGADFVTVRVINPIFLREDSSPTLRVGFQIHSNF